MRAGSNLRPRGGRGMREHALLRELQQVLGDYSPGAARVASATCCTPWRAPGSRGRPTCARCSG
ncbi:MAG: hypothetical protein MZW92_76115 [Comamonadaceae bacterium]|nr:hypothetical protein [Comamonadaceae bacterium]